MSSNVVDLTSLVARGYTSSGNVPASRLVRLMYWPWPTIIAGLCGLGLLASTLIWIYKVLELFVMAAWIGMMR